MKPENAIIRIALILSLLLLLSNCGTIIIPQVLPEARGVGKSNGQENIKVKIIPLTSASLASANKVPYIRRIIEASDLNQPANLVSVEEAINQNLPTQETFGSYRLGIGDILSITQQVKTITQSIEESIEAETNKDISKRELVIADDGFISMLGVGRLPIAGLTQFEAAEC